MFFCQSLGWATQPEDAQQNCVIPHPHLHPSDYFQNLRHVVVVVVVVVSLHVQTDHFNWGCANVLIGLGDPYSTGGANAFEKAAEEKQIDVCTMAKYAPGSRKSSKEAIKEIIDKKCCLATVVFGQSQDLTSLFLEAHEQGYAGEWIVGDEMIGSLPGIVNDLKTHLPESSVHELLRGMCESTLE